MDEIIVAVLIALLAGFALFDIIKFVQSLERGSVWKFLLGFGLPCAMLAYIAIGLGRLEGALNAARLIRDVAFVKP